MMKIITANLCVAVAVASFSLGAAARADDLGSLTPPHDPALAAKINQDIDKAAGISAAKPSTDVEQRINDLEATRSAVDQRKGSPISLSVSGWVGEQVQYNIKQ
ncbi:hypothetical protein [Hyphomicrobium sp. 2TAF46]|uniref:hypothetical protein n=1 Tax=Hyphomicrobium sp. 2TAF46 TaxID=3233019 RepID=UPI003F8F1298